MANIPPQKKQAIIQAVSEFTRTRVENAPGEITTIKIFEDAYNLQYPNLKLSRIAFPQFFKPIVHQIFPEVQEGRNTLGNILTGAILLPTRRDNPLPAPQAPIQVLTPRQEQPPAYGTPRALEGTITRDVYDSDMRALRAELNSTTESQRIIRIEVDGLLGAEEGQDMAIAGLTNRIGDLEGKQLELKTKVDALETKLNGVLTDSKAVQDYFFVLDPNGQLVENKFANLIERVDVISSFMKEQDSFNRLVYATLQKHGITIPLPEQPMNAPLDPRAEALGPLRPPSPPRAEVPAPLPASPRMQIQPSPPPQLQVTGKRRKVPLYMMPR